MINLLAKRFIKNYKEYTRQEVREQYGTLCSILSIILNIILVLFKYTIGLIVHSVSIQADALNNLSDVGSNLATLFGFKLASKHPDNDHPYGHGRFEYISGLIISFLILLVGFNSLKESITKIIHPQAIAYSNIAAMILVASIIIKLWMGMFNKEVGNKIQSASLLAASKDSINDVFTTLATLISLLLSLVTDLPVDGIIGSFVSIVVLKAGIEVCKDTINPLLGLAPDHELIKEIEKFIMSYDKPLGIHDLMMHDYGPGRMFMTLHVEVDCDDDIMEIHEEIDRIEKDIQEHFHIFTTIHYDPVDVGNPIIQECKAQVLMVIKEINHEYSIHDFRMVPGKDNTNLIFDVLVPANDHIDHKDLKQMIQTRIKKLHPNYTCVIEIDHSYV